MKRFVVFDGEGLDGLVGVRPFVLDARPAYFPNLPVRLAAIVSFVGVGPPFGIAVALGCVFGELNPFTLVLGNSPVRSVDPQHHRCLSLVGAFQFGEERRVGSGMYHFEG